MRHHLTPSTACLPFKWLLVGSALVGLSFSAHSMDLLQAYEAAQMNDATILAARATAVGERERLPQAKSQLLPNLSANLSENRNQLKSVSPNFLGEPQTSHANYPSRNQTLTLRQPLYRPQLAAQYRQAKALVDDAESTLQQEEQNLAVRVSGAYFEAMLTHDQLALILAQQTAYIAQLDAARKAFSAGSGIRTDIDEAQSRIDMNRALEIEARQNVTYTLQQLQTLVNQPIDKLSTLNVAQLQLQNPQPDSLKDWIARAELNNPQLQSLKSRVEVAQQEIKKAQSGHLPTLDAVAQWSNSKSESVTNTSSSYTNNSVGLQLNVPLFAGGYVNSQVRQTLAGLDRAEQSLEAGRRDLALRVHKEFRGVTENIPKIRALEQALLSSDQLVLSSRKSMQAGSRTVLDILNAEQQRVVVLRDLAQARYMYLISKVRLLAVAGDVDRAALVSINQALQ
jgi:outer membrane protein/protease secretion system outer membrane protein